VNKQGISVAEAKARFSELVNRVAYGKEQILITRRGKPVAVLTSPFGVGLSITKGWLEEDDLFFQEMDQIERTRHKRELRVSKFSKKAR
jgi:prevent-host-death family protein